MDHLRQLLAEEIIRADAGNKEADLERKNVAELQLLLEYEKNKCDEARKMADAAFLKAEDYRVQIETLRGEVEKTNLKWEQVNKKLEAEKKTAMQEKTSSEKRVKEEECHANNILLKQLEEEKKKAEKLHKEIHEIMSKRSIESVELDEAKKKFEAEKKKVAEEKRHIEEEKMRAVELRRISEENKRLFTEEKCRADNLLMQLEEEKQKVENLRREMEEALSSQMPVDLSELEELKRNLEVEKKKVAHEKIRFEEEKNRVIELRRISETNKERFADEKCRADNLVVLLEEEKQKLKELNSEMQKVLLSYKPADSSDLEELKRNLEEEKKKIAQEKMHFEEEKTIFLEQRRIAEAYEKSCVDEKCRADNLLMQLEEEKQKFEKLQKEIQEVKSSQKAKFSAKLDEVKKNLELEKKKVARERKRADLELSRNEGQKKLAEARLKNEMEEKGRADKLFKELEKSREMIQNLEGELNKVTGMLEAERKKVSTENRLADLQKLKAEEQGKIAIANEKRAIEEKCRGDNLSQELDNAKQKLLNMEYELHNIKTSSTSPAFAVNELTARVNLLQEQLKFEKKRAKHAKEVVKLEKGRNTILEQELQRLKHDFQCFLDHLGMLSDVFGARNVGNHVPQKFGPSQMNFCDADALRMPCLSSRDVSCLLKPNMRFVRAAPHIESTSGMENELDSLQGGSRGDILPSSAAYSNTSSFLDEHLVGSQERFAGSLGWSAGFSIENTDEQNSQQAQVLKYSNDESYKQMSGKKIGVVGEQNILSPLETSTGRAKKRRKISDDFESIKYLHLEGRRIYQEAEKKLFSLHDSLIRPIMNEQIEKERFSQPVSKSNTGANPGRPYIQNKQLLEPEVVLQQAGESKVQMQVAPGLSDKRGSSQQLHVGRGQSTHNQDAVSSVLEVMNGDYMKLLDLDDEVAEEQFRMVMERPLSPTLPEFGILEFSQKVQAQTVSENIEAVYQRGFSVQNKNQLYFVLFSDMEDIGSVTRIFCATRTCVDQCCLFFQTNWAVQDILGVLLLENELTPREKACVLFSLLLLNFSAISSNKSVTFQVQEQMVTLSAQMHAVLNSDTREMLKKICNLHDVLALGEEFVLNRKVLSDVDVSGELLVDCGSSIGIVHQGENTVLWPKIAPTDLVVTGSSILASIYKAVGHLGSLCEFSLKLLHMGRADYSLALSILHNFACLCGEDYFTNSNYSSVMKVVKSVVAFMEASLSKGPIKDLQAGDITWHHFTTCVRCPFKEGSVTLDAVSSELLDELRRHLVPQIPGATAHSLNSKAVSCLLSDVLSSLELIASIMCWDWVCENIVQKLFHMLELSCQNEVFSTALVVLLGYIGRLGVEARGYNDAGVEGIRHHLLGLLCQATTSKCDSAVPMAILYGVTGLCPKGHEIFQKVYDVIHSSKDWHSASSPSDDIVSKFLSSLSSKQATSLASLLSFDSGLAA
ncbi:uncharacterized protein LOC130825287 isoform X2 [Amaranthus tricolor]|nr:uncharacterized protein LOC130825287 isoform X2 [Amaranthus tricolor]XP_057546417.1 uncharacterized protein LOC130825287 isoform X2 [Amaranthus tricolor]XP_057546418.1 uncharacterized protein LOC130825287 isoform X2 [Amaranthus tricolor]